MIETSAGTAHSSAEAGDSRPDGAPPAEPVLLTAEVLPDRAARRGWAAVVSALSPVWSRSVVDSTALPTRMSAPSRRLIAYRDDGPIATAIAIGAHGSQPPLLGAVGAVLATGILLITGEGGRGWSAWIAPLVALVLCAPGGSHRHRGPRDWLVAPVIRTLEYGYLVVLGVTFGVSKPMIFLLLSVIAFHHYDTVYRTRQRMWPRPWVAYLGLGWEGRMLVGAAAAYAGALSGAYSVLACALVVIFVGESLWALTHVD